MNNPIEITWMVDGDNGSLLIRTNGGRDNDDWVENTVNIQIPLIDHSLSCDDINARYIVPMLRAIASQMIRHREPVV